MSPSRLPVLLLLSHTTSSQSPNGSPTSARSAPLAVTLPRFRHIFHLVCPLGCIPTKLLILPGIDMVIESIRSTMSHKNLETWQGWLKNDKNFGQTVEGTPAGLRCIFTADPENIKAILATQFQDYGKGEPFHEDWNDFLGDGIFASDNQPWHDSRQLLRPQFIKDRVSDLEVFEEHVQILMKAVANGGVEGAPGVATDGV